jgi:hypothetical protein
VKLFWWVVIAFVLGAAAGWISCGEEKR